MIEVKNVVQDLRLTSLKPLNFVKAGSITLANNCGPIYVIFA